MQSFVQDFGPEAEPLYWHCTDRNEMKLIGYLAQVSRLFGGGNMKFSEDWYFFSLCSILKIIVLFGSTRRLPEGWSSS